MGINRQKLIEHLEKSAEQLRLKIEGYDEAKGIDSGRILMWVAKKIMLTHLLVDLYQGKFDCEDPNINFPSISVDK